MKKISAFIVALLVAINIYGAYSGTCGDSNVNGGKNVKWTLSNGVLTISGSGAMLDYDPYNPSNYMGWSLYKDDIKSIVIQNGVTSIGDWCFMNCEFLTSITVANSVTSIGKKAFLECSSLSSITIPNTVTKIGEFAFDGCTSLSTITIPNSVTTIGEYAFSACSSLKSVTIGKGVKNINEYAFSGCTSIKSVTWNVKKCNNESFVFLFASSCSKITSFTFGSEVEYIPIQLCQDMTKLTSITIPNSVTAIGNMAFSGCISLSSVKIGSKVTKIGEEAFYGCESLASITIPNSVTTIGGDVFDGCKSLTSVVWNVKECKYSTDIYDDHTPFGGIAQQITSFTFGSEVKKIPFYLCGGMRITSVTIPNSVTTIEEGAFANSWLTSVTIGKNVTNIANSAFSNCGRLKSVYLNAVYPPKVGSNSFNAISSDAILYVPCGSIDDYDVSPWNTFFSDIQGPKTTYKITVKSNNSAWGQANVDSHSTCGTVISATPNDGYRFVRWSDGDTENPRSLILSSNLTLTAEFAKKITGEAYTISVSCNTERGSVSGGGEYEKGSTAIIKATPNEGYSFLQWSDGNTDNPRYIIVTKDLTLTAEFAKKITGEAYTISVSCNTEHGSVSGGGEYEKGSIATIKATPNEGYSFLQWSDGNTDNPRSITVTNDLNLTAEFKKMPNLNQKCGDNLYWDFTDSVLTIIGIGDMYDYDYDDDDFSRAPWSKLRSGISYVVFNGEITYIGSDAFFMCRSLTSITLPNSVTKITDNVFRNCTSLTSITFPNSVTEIGRYAFASCTSLKSITIPNGVTKIGKGAFYDCTSLTSITFPNSLTEIEDDDFYYCTSLTSIVWNVKRLSRGGCQAFSGTSHRITSFVFGNEVEHIPSYICKGMTKLTSVTIPGSVTEIGDEAFAKCISLTTIICRAKEVPPLEDKLNCFCFVPSYLVTLYVPEESLELYKTACVWKDFRTILPIPETDIEDVFAPNVADKTTKIFYKGQIYIIRDGKTYTIMGQEVNIPL